MPKKKRKPKKEKMQLKMVISRTYSESQKVNTGNYESRDFFASSTRTVELPITTSQEEQYETSKTLLALVKDEVKAALQVEVDAASGTKPADSGVVVGEAPSVPDAFDPSVERVYPGKKFVPREDDVDLELE